ncbi:hypothetical protein AX14_011889 [Amanita brunnescens Koide BX004]|nr:hypothetical protein AX14_011889 [Amanita brunnescens Koide BX004]
MLTWRTTSRKRAPQLQRLLGLDIDALSSLVPDADLAAPNSEAIISVYRLLLQQVTDLNATQSELDESRAEVEKKDVELDQALRDRESLSKDFEQSLESSHVNLEKYKRERDQLDGPRSASKSWIAELENAQTSSTTDVDRSGNSDIALQSERSEARLQSLESQLRELRSAETSTKFKLEMQHLQLAQTEAERTSTELTSKIEESVKYRRTKNGELSNLQASYDALKQSHESAQASFKALQPSHTTQSHQLRQALVKVQDLTSQLAEQEATYASEVNGLRRLVNMMEEREQQAKEIVEGIEKEWAGVGEKAEKREAALKNEDATYIGAIRTRKSGKTFTEVYVDYVRLQDDFAQKCAEHDHMDRTLTAVLAQTEERAPILSQQRAAYERLHSETPELAIQLAQGNVAQDNTQKLNQSLRENGLLQKQLGNLGRQVQSLLREIARRDDPTFLDAAEDWAAGAESEASPDRERTFEQDGVGREGAHEAMQELAAQLERQKKNSENTIQSYVKERNALKAMLARVDKATSNTVAGANGGSAAAKRLEKISPRRSGKEHILELLAQANAKIEYLIDRHRMHQEEFALHARQVDDLTKRNQKPFDQWMRIDIDCTMNALTYEQRRRFGRVYKAGWSRRTLERAHLSDLMSNVQKMHNELERAGENDRRRLESQLQTLESQTQDLRAQSHLDRTMQDLLRTRESLVGAETSKKHLEERVADFNRQIQGNEEKLSVYERKRAADRGISNNLGQDTNREQQLESEVAELRSALKVAEFDLITFREELTQLKGRQDELQKALDAERAAWVSDKTMEDTIVDLSTSERNAETDRSSREDNIRQLEERAKAAEECYSNEVVSHANSIKSIEKLKRDLTCASSSARDSLTVAETAKAKLTTSENSWRQQREALDKELQISMQGARMFRNRTSFPISTSSPTHVQGNLEEFDCIVPDEDPPALTAAARREGRWGRLRLALALVLCQVRRCRVLQGFIAKS